MHSITADTRTRLIRAVVGGNPTNEDLERFVADLRVHVDKLRASGREFDMLVDMREAPLLPQSLTAIAQEPMKWLVDNGLRRNAYLVASVLLKMQFDRLAISPAFACFKTEEEALAWLAG